MGGQFRRKIGFFLALAAFGGLGASVGTAAFAQQGGLSEQCLLPASDVTGSRIDLTVSDRLKIDRGSVIPSANDDILEFVRTECRKTAPDITPPPAVTGRGQRAGKKPPAAALSVPAYMCVGEASLKLANSLAREKNYSAALCAFKRAGTLAARAGAVGFEVEAEDKRAAAATQWSAYIGGQSEQARALRNEAVAALEAAIARAPSDARNAALFDAYMAAGQDNKAEEKINALPQQDPAVARALVRLALFRLEVRKSPASEILPLLPRIQASAPKSVFANAAVGELYRLLGNDEAALRAFAMANAPGSIDDGDLAADGAGRVYNLAFVRFRLAEFAARSARSFADWTRVRDLALASLKAGGEQSDFYVPLCLAHIALGGRDVRDGVNTDWCEKKSSTSGQGELLRGLYALKRAQCFANFKFIAGREPSAEEIRWREYVRIGQQAFEGGRDMLEETPAGISDSEKLARSARRQQLKQGSQTAQWTLGYCRMGERPTDQSQGSLFDRLGLSSCLPVDPVGGTPSALPGGPLCSVDTQP